MCNANAKVFRMTRFAFMAFFVVCCHLSATAQAEPRMTECQVTLTESEPNPTPTVILTPITYRYMLTYSASCQAKAILNAKPPMECHSPMTEILPSQTSDQVMASVTVQCQFKRPGYYYSPPITVEVSKLTSQIKQTLSPKLQPITILPHHPDNPTPLPLEASLQFMPWQKNNGHIWLALIALGIILICGYWIHARYAQNLKPISASVILPPSPIERFKSELSNLAKVTPTDTESWKAYYDCLSHALRQYLTDRAQTDALQLTTYQLQSKLQTLHLPSDLRCQILAVLRQSDQVKFTPHMPQHAANIHILQSMNDMADTLENFFIEREQQMEATTQDSSSVQTKTS